jgi:transposase InsO family protein
MFVSWNGCMSESLSGVTEYVGSDNGSKFSAKVVHRWLSPISVQALYIDPAALGENGESFNSKLRDELLDEEILCALKEAKTLIGKWRMGYMRFNTFRLHSYLKYHSPAPEAYLN